MSWGGGLRASSALAIAIAVSGAVACATLAGTAGKEVDPCFDGCDGSISNPRDKDSGEEEGPDGSSTSSSSGSSTSSSSGSNDSGSKKDGTVIEEDDGGCNCPTGTISENGVCTMKLSPAPALACKAPLQLPSCGKKYLIRLCDTDPTFPFEAGCHADDADHPTTFIRFGVTGSNKWKAEFKGAYTISRMNDQCTQGINPCISNGTATSTFTITSAPNESVVPIAKRPGAGCDDISLEMSEVP